MFGKFRRSFLQNPMRRIVYLLAVLASVTIFFSAQRFKIFLRDIPSISRLEEYTPSLTTRVFDINNQVIAEFSIERRAFLPLNKIPVDMQNAVIAMEDKGFFRHWGISPRGILRAALRNFRRRRVAQGGSTITQQLSKLIFLTPEKTISRKIKEVLISLQIERNFSKQEILQLYLNQIYLGSGVYGVQSAARLYFGKKVPELTLAECALLAGFIASPATYSPFNHPDKAARRRSLVLYQMLKEGFITGEEKESANQEPIPESKFYSTEKRAPYFIEHVRKILEPKYGINALWKGGLKIYTTLDLKMQTFAEEVMEKHLKIHEEESAKERELKEKEEAQELNPDEELEVSTHTVSTHTWRLQGAFVASDVRTGAIRVMIGGRDYKESQFNRATQAYRQPGSTFKPFVWMAALQNGYTAASIVEDSPIAYYYDGRDWRLLEGATDQYSINLATQPFVGNPDFKIWVPRNFDGKFLGRITLRKGLEKSRNLVSVHLVDKIGAPLAVEIARRAGVTAHLDAVPSIGLGTSVVSPMVMANAFATFANNGIHVKPYSIIRVIDANGKLLEEHVPVEKEVFSTQYNYLIINLMRGVVENGTGRYAKRLKRPLAGKTGTTQENRDMWFIGMTPDLVSAAWMGYDDFSSLGERRGWTGGATVLPWWTEIMQEMLKDEPIRDFPVPEGILFVTIDAESGKLALPTCKKRYLEAFIKGTEPREFCDIDHSKLPDTVSSSTTTLP